MPALRRQSSEEPPFADAGRAAIVDALAAEIGAACDAPQIMASRIRTVLERAVCHRDLLTPKQREPNSRCYARHVIHGDPLGRFTILAIVWGPGQFSPVHAHDAWCAYAVHDGPLRETLYAGNAADRAVKPVCTEVREPGYSCFAGAGLDQIHSLGNSGLRPAISIHVYGVERERIATHVNRLVDVTP